MPVDMFIKIDGIEGESRDHKHQGEIELLSFSWGVQNSVTDEADGGNAGKVSVSDLSIVKQMDATSSELFEKCRKGEHISNALITLVRRGENGEEFFKIKLTDVLVSSYQPGAANTDGAAPMESVSFNFGSVDVQVPDQKGDFVTQVACNFPKAGVERIWHHE